LGVHGLDHLAEDEGEPLGKPLPSIRSRWSRAIARATNTVSSASLRYGWHEAIAAVNDEHEKGPA